MAQTIVDDSAQGIPPEDAKLIVTVLSHAIPNPQAAEIRSIYRSSGTYAYCGRIKVLGRSGEHSEFVPFYVNLDANVPYILFKEMPPHLYEETEARLGIFGCLN